MRTGIPTKRNHAPTLSFRPKRRDPFSNSILFFKRNLKNTSNSQFSILNSQLQSYAVASIRSGDDIKTVQGNLGHATAAFTLDVYGHVTDQMQKESAARMEQYFHLVASA